MKRDNVVLRARVEAFITEFPFIERYAQVAWFDTCPKVQRVDLDLLERAPWLDGWELKRHLLGDLRFVLLTRNGREILEVDPERIVSQKFNLWRPGTWISKHIAGETVYDTIRRLGSINVDEIAYVLEFRDQFPGGDHPDFGIVITLHKVPAGRSFSQWITEIRKIARREVQEEIAAVDNV